MHIIEKVCKFLTCLYLISTLPLFALAEITGRSIKWWIAGTNKFPSKYMINSEADTTFVATIPVY